MRELVGDAELDRVGRHPELGEVTMCQLLATWAVHDLDHIAQIYAALAGSYDAEAGPWKADLGILDAAGRSGVVRGGGGLATVRRCTQYFRFPIDRTERASHRRAAKP
ncbi:MAG TPA: hypothetical protein VGQ89_01795 [Candidatus Limnocylindrales bacterium]|nr:hypothetical protein [Candidatus Limnocylindrales bacterium]